MSALEQFRKQMTEKRRQFAAQSETQRVDFAAKTARAEQRFSAAQAKNADGFAADTRSAEDLRAAAQPERKRLQAQGKAIIKAAGHLPDIESLPEPFQQAERMQRQRQQAMSGKRANTDARLSRRRLPE